MKMRARRSRHVPIVQRRPFPTGHIRRGWSARRGQCSAHLLQDESDDDEEFVFKFSTKYAAARDLPPIKSAATSTGLRPTERLDLAWPSKHGCFRMIGECSGRPHRHIVA